MSEGSQAKGSNRRRARWIAAGFIGAFALSVFTVIYTGLNVGGYSSAEFDAGFRSVTMVIGEVRRVDLVFESPGEFEDAELSLVVPEAVALVGPAEAPVTLAIGENVVPVEVRATAAGSGYLVARVEAEEPIGLYRVFLTVEAPSAGAGAQ
jgi:hypothetical protein